MKNLLLSLLLISIFIIFVYPSSSKAQDISSEEQNSAEGITLFPLITYIYENDLGSIYNIKITNNTDQTFTYQTQEQYVIINKEGVPETIESEQLNLLDFDETPFELAPLSSKEIPVRVKISYNSIIDKYPAIAFITSSNSQMKDLYSVFIFQNFDGELDLSVITKINSNVPIIFSPNVNLTGSLENTGDKFFNPSGTVKIFKGDLNIFEADVTNQIEGLMLAGDKKEYNLEWLNKNELLDSIGRYTIETSINPNPYTQTFVNKTYTYFLPGELIIYFGCGIALISLFTLIVNKTRSHKKGKLSSRELDIETIS